MLYSLLFHNCSTISNISVGFAILRLALYIGSLLRRNQVCTSHCCEDLPISLIFRKPDPIALCTTGWVAIRSTPALLIRVHLEGFISSCRHCSTTPLIRRTANSSRVSTDSANSLAHRGSLSRCCCSSANWPISLPIADKVICFGLP